MVGKIAEFDLKLDANAVSNMSIDKLKRAFPGIPGIKPEELGDLVKRMLTILALERGRKSLEPPIGLYTLRIDGFDRRYLFRLDVGYSNGFIYPEFYGYNKEINELRLF